MIILLYVYRCILGYCDYYTSLFLLACIIIHDCYYNELLLLVLVHATNIVIVLTIKSINVVAVKIPILYHGNP